MKLPVVAFLAVALGCGACHKLPTSPASAPGDAVVTDNELRAFLGIRTVRGIFRLPESAAGYYPVAILFAEGREVSRKKCPMLLSQGSARPPRNGEFQLLLQFEGRTFRRAALVDNGNETDLGGGYAYWDQFSSSGWRSISADENLKYQGIEILGIMAAQGPESKTGVALYFNADKPAASNKYMVLIGVDYDTDAEKLRERFMADQAISPGKNHP